MTVSDAPAMRSSAGSAPPTRWHSGSGSAVATMPPFALGRGLSYRVLARSAAAKARFISCLAESDLIAVVPSDGGFVGNLTVWENLVLPATYHGSPRLEDLEARTAEIFGRLGSDAERCAQLCGELPGQLVPLDLRRAAFVRAMLAEPEIIVYDSLFDGLARDEADSVCRFDGVFHLYFPFRTSVWAERDVLGLPEVAVHETFLIGD